MNLRHEHTPRAPCGHLIDFSPILGRFRQLPVALRRIPQTQLSLLPLDAGRLAKTMPDRRARPCASYSRSVPSTGELGAAMARRMLSKAGTAALHVCFFVSGSEGLIYETALAATYVLGWLPRAGLTLLKPK